MEALKNYQKKSINAEDTDGNKYSSVEDMYRKELDPTWVAMEKDMGAMIEGEGRVGNRDNWYSKQKTYWDGQPTTIDGVLNGYEKYHPMESEYSCRIFKDHCGKLPGRTRAFDIGAGIGRVTKTILQVAFDDIDILD